MGLVHLRDLHHGGFGRDRFGEMGHILELYLDLREYGWEVCSLVFSLLKYTVNGTSFCFFLGMFQFSVLGDL